MKTEYKPMYPVSENFKSYCKMINDYILLSYITGKYEASIFIEERKRIEIAVGCYDPD